MLGNAEIILYFVQVLAISGSAIIAVAAYLRRQRMERAKWSQELFKQFYDDTDIKAAMKHLHYSQEKTLAVLRRRVDNPSDIIGDEDQLLLERIDRLLSFLDYVEHFHQQRVIQSSDVHSSFRHWLQLTAGDQFEELTSYIRTYGFLNLQRLIDLREFAVADVRRTNGSALTDD